MINLVKFCCFKSSFSILKVMGFNFLSSYWFQLYKKLNHFSFSTFRDLFAQLLLRSSSFLNEVTYWVLIYWKCLIKTVLPFVIKINDYVLYEEFIFKTVKYRLKTKLFDVHIYWMNVWTFHIISILSLWFI